MRHPYAVYRWLFTAVAAGLLVTATVTALGAAGLTVTRLTSVGWDRHLGRPGVGPIAFFFLCLADRICGEAFFEVWWQAYPVHVPILAILTLWVGAALSISSRPQVARASPGGARWASSSDLRRYLKGEPDGPLRGYLGLTARGKMLRLPERLRCAHTLVVGATGARKSTAYHKPNLVMDASEGVSAIVIDLKYPDTTSGFFDLVPLFARAGHDVQLFLPYGEHSLRLPLLANASTFEVASEIADMISPETGEPDVDFYRSEERRLVTGLLMGLTRDGQASLGALYRLLSRGRSAVQAYVHRHPDPAVRSFLGGFFDFDLRMQGNVVGGLAGALQLFADPRLERVTTAAPDPRGNVDLEGVGLRPTLLYLGIPQEHLQGARGKVLLRLVKRALDLALLKTANAHGGRLPNHVSCYLDEFANLGALPNIAENFATMRSRRVAYHVSLQNRAQGEALYGREVFRSFFTNNFQQVILFPRALKFEDAEYFSRALGMRAAVDKTVGTSREGMFAASRRSETLREVAEPLLPPEAMATWPEEVGVLLAGGAPPAKVLLPRLDEARVLGRRNPLFGVRRALGDAVTPALLAQILLEERSGVAPFPSRAQPRVPANEVGTEKPPEPPRAMPPSGKSLEPRAALLDWVDDLLQSSVAATLHMNPKTAQPSKLSFRNVPPALGRPRALATWLERGWIKVSGDEIGLVGKGLALLGEGRLRALSPRGTRTLSGASAGREGLSERDVAALRRYIATHGHLLQGHPQRQGAGVADLPSAIGIYRPATVLLEKVLVEALLEGPLPSDLKPRKAGPQGAQRWVVELAAARLEATPKLRAWCEANGHRLAEGPAPHWAEGVRGAYLPESIALPKVVLETVLGRVPAAGKPTRPLVEGKRIHLIALKLPREAPEPRTSHRAATRGPRVGP